MAPIFTISSEDHEIKQHRNFEDAVHFCFNYMLDPSCNALEKLTIIKTDALPDHCQNNELKRSLVNNIMLFQFKKGTNKQKFCIIIEVNGDISPEELRDIIRCASFS